MELTALWEGIGGWGQLLLVVVLAVALLWIMHSLFGFRTPRWTLGEFGPDEQDEALCVQDEAIRLAEEHGLDAEVYLVVALPLGNRAATKPISFRIATRSKELHDAWAEHRPKSPE